MKKRFLPSLTAFLLLTACALATPTAAPPTQAAASPSPARTRTMQPTATAATATPSVTAPTQVVPGAIARMHLIALTGQIGARPAGTESEKQAGQYIEAVFKGLGYDTQVQSFSRIGWVGEDEIEAMVSSSNIVAVKAGDSKESIVVGAHYDSGDEGLGADDNASGVAVLLEVAEWLKDRRTPYTVHFVAFGAEEAGLLGSTTYVERLSKEERKGVVAMVNLDSLTAGDFAYVYSRERDKAVLRDWALSWASRNSLDLRTIRNVDLNDEEGYATGDYSAFQRAGIPFAYFEATNWTLGDKDGYTQVDPQYGDQGAIIHTGYDRLTYLDETFPGRVDEHLAFFTRIVEAILTQFEL